MTRQEVTNFIADFRNKPIRYFTYEDNYCDVEDCKLDECKEHEGSLLSVEWVKCRMDHEPMSVCLCLGSIGSSYIYFDSELGEVYTCYKGDKIAVHIPKEMNDEIESDMFDIWECSG